MLAYYFDLALRSLKRNRALTALMVLAIALGIGASMTTLTVLHVLSGDPLPGRSGSIYYPQLDPQDMKDYTPGVEPPEQLTWTDGMYLLRAKRATRQALMTGGMVPLQSAQSSIDPFQAAALYTPPISFRCSACRSNTAMAGARGKMTAKPESSLSPQI